MKNSSIKCKRCHRVLVNPNARQRGYGDVCWRKYLAEQQNKKSLFELDKNGGRN